jgi:hypothetical protein
MPKDQGGLGILDPEIMNIIYSQNGYGTFSMKMEGGKKSLRGNNFENKPSAKLW